MVMHNKPDILDLILGNYGDSLTPNGEINSIVPQVDRERDQELDFEGFTIDPYDENTFIVDMDQLVGEGDCAFEQIAPSQDHNDANILSFSPGQESAENLFLIVSQGSPSDDTDIPTIDRSCLSVSDGNDSDSSYSSRAYSTSFSSDSQFSLPTTTTTGSNSNVPLFVKEELKMAIKCKRMREGKEDLKVEFAPPRPEQLTEEEEIRRIEKREKNKMAAQKCREKKRVKAEQLEAETRVLNKKQSAYKLEIQKLIEERDHLMEIINIHKFVCPLFRTKSSAF